jgi:hypothetical protein
MITTPTTGLHNLTQILTHPFQVITHYLAYHWVPYPQQHSQHLTTHNTSTRSFHAKVQLSTAVNQHKMLGYLKSHRIHAASVWTNCLTAFCSSATFPTTSPTWTGLE